MEIAWSLVAKGKSGEAVALLQETVKKDPRNADARLLLGSILMEAGERNESIAQLSEAVRLRPKLAEAQNALGEAYEHFGELKSARPAFERAVAIDPAFGQARVNLAAAMLQAGEGERAAAHLERAIVLLGDKPDAAYPRYLRAKLYVARRNSAKAVADLEKAVALRPDFAEASSDLGEARKTLLDDEGASQAYRRAVDLSPDDVVADAPRVEFAQRGSRRGGRSASGGGTTGSEQPVRAQRTATGIAERRAAEADAVKRRLAEVLRDKDQADQKLVSALEINNKGSELEKGGDVRGALERYPRRLSFTPTMPASELTVPWHC